MNKPQKERKYKLTTLIVILALGLGLVQLFISNRLATTGEVVRELEVKAAKTEQKNRLLEEEIGQMGSLSKVSQKAEELGLAKAAKILYFTPQVPVALGR